MGKMGTNEAAFLKIQMNEKGIRAILPTIVCEWVLIILLFIDALLSYLVTKFAHYCQLPAPCLLCSRIDHVLDGKEPDFYYSLLCSSHRSDLSSLISCQLHDKLADGYKMCEECLLSFTGKNKPNQEMHRLMAGKLGAEHGGGGFLGQSGNREIMSGSVNTRVCSCCSKAWRSRNGSQKMFPQKTHPGVTKPNLPLPGSRSPGCRSPISRSPGCRSPVSRSPESLKKIRDKHSVQSNPFYKKGNNIVREKTEFKGNAAVPCDSDIKPPLLDSFEQININDSTDVRPSVSNASTGYGLGDQDWSQDYPKAGPYAELISDSSPSLSNVCLTLPPIYGASELVSLPNTPPSVGASPKKSENASGVNIGNVSIHEHEDLRGTTSISRVEEFIVENSKLHSSLSSSDTSPRLQRHGDEPNIDVYNSYRTQTNPHSQFEERLEESYSDSVERTAFSETDGANIVHKLKQQTHDHLERINGLYRELEEERNASNIAADEAMAMIRRLHEEKASLHMEAMQYLRMMEEQAEHDADDLDKANDLLVDREKDIQDLEAELEFYRLHFPEEQLIEKMIDGNSQLKENVTMKSASLSHAKNNRVWIELCRGKNEPAIELSWLEFKDDKFSISEGLKNLESKLRENEAYLSNRKPSNEEETSSSSSSDDDSQRKDRNREVDKVVTLENEVSDLRCRLKTLEANQDFLERALISLQKGNEGGEVVLDIARQLQELCHIGIRLRSDPVP